MTTVCPNCAAFSEDEEWCDDCGRPILHTAPRRRSTGVCPVCGEPEEGRYCQGCRYDFASAATGKSPTSGDTALAPGPHTKPLPVFDDDTARAATGKTGGPVPRGPFAAGADYAVTVSADRAFHARLAGDPGAAPFPPYAPARTLPLNGSEIRIGRGRRGREDRPEIDLAEPPADLAVSHLHAVLLREGDGWTVIDLGSYNGTRLDGERLTPNAPKRFPVDSTLHIGAWTAIRLHRAEPRGALR